MHQNLRASHSSSDVYCKKDKNAGEYADRAQTLLVGTWGNTGMETNMESSPRIKNVTV